jgi:hypothetical protein
MSYEEDGRDDLMMKGLEVCVRSALNKEWREGVVRRDIARLCFFERKRRLCKMEKFEPGAPSNLPEPETVSIEDSAALDRELELWAELLLDIYLDKRRRNLRKDRERKHFDSAEN